jgi:hypothetical protein
MQCPFCDSDMVGRPFLCGPNPTGEVEFTCENDSCVHFATERDRYVTIEDEETLEDAAAEMEEGI